MFRPGSLGARLLAMGAVVSFTGVCPVCGRVVPVRTDDTCVRHRFPGPGGRRGRLLNPALPCRGTGRTPVEGYIERVY